MVERIVAAGTASLTGNLTSRVMKPVIFTIVYAFWSEMSVLRSESEEQRGDSRAIVYLLYKVKSTRDCG
jgi:hypothetical protein